MKDQFKGKAPVKKVQNSTTSAPTKPFTTKKSILNQLLDGRKKIIYLTKVIISTLQYNLGPSRYVVCFLLSKYIKTLLENLKGYYMTDPKFIYEMRYSKKEIKMLNTAVKYLKDLEEKIVK